MGYANEHVDGTLRGDLSTPLMERIRVEVCIKKVIRDPGTWRELKEDAIVIWQLPKDQMGRLITSLTNRRVGKAQRRAWW